MNIASKLIRSIRTDGLSRTIVRCVVYPRSLMRIRKLQRALSTRDPAVIFETIHRATLWSKGESISGPGSSLAYTQNLRAQLPTLLAQFSIRSIYDAPCGDFNWMSTVDLETPQIDYRGADIVRAVIESNRGRFTGPRRRFDVANIISDPFPDADLWICRDALFHFSYEDIGRTLRHFVASKIKYVLTTTHLAKGTFENKDIPTGDYRPIDLFSKPFNFPSDVLFRITDYVEPYEPREMCLWSRQQLIEALDRFPGNGT
jgi:hypothetical protein